MGARSTLDNPNRGLNEALTITGGLSCTAPNQDGCHDALDHDTVRCVWRVARGCSRPLDQQCPHDRPAERGVVLQSHRLFCGAGRRSTRKLRRLSDRRNQRNHSVSARDLEKPGWTVVALPQYGNQCHSLLDWSAAGVLNSLFAAPVSAGIMVMRFMPFVGRGLLIRWTPPARLY